MGMFRAQVTLVGRDDRFTGAFTVDTGANYSLAPAFLLERLGIEKTGVRVVEMANGATVKMPIGECQFQIESFSERWTCPILFGEDDSLFLLGATTLEDFSLGVDPMRRRLVSVNAMLFGLKDR